MEITEYESAKNVVDLTVTDITAIYDVKIEGDVGTLKIAQFHSGENNLTITGKVSEGITHSTRMPSMGFFECENMEIIQNGKWNSNLFIRANLYDKSVEYKPYQNEELESALDGLGLGEETTITTPTGSTVTAFKTAAVSVSETKNEVFETMKQSEEMTKLLEQIEDSNADEQKVLEATPIAALDINISTYSSPQGSSAKYEEQEVSELTEGNEFTEPSEPIEPSEPTEPTKPNEPTEPSEPETPSEPEAPSESQDSGDMAAEENVVEDAQATTTTPTETGDVNSFVLACIMLLGSIITAIVLARKEDLLIIR